ncbi:uncharacterized protein C1orf131 homolog [Penaeus monodon]|uniref:uncharacterized protein C1orf131 homolog n=1 Tax=Penaeus monodon TaxID=6687 RepID=UPI0018A76A4B|nr:uncharacterized protein C1orf131 homolog [Penaeus monodon]
MDPTLLEKLSQYCDQVVGDRVDTGCELQRKSKKNKKKKNKRNIMTDESIEETNEESPVKKKKRKDKKGTKESEVEHLASKEVISDVKKKENKFCNDDTDTCDSASKTTKQYIENVKTVNGEKFTDDGFKVVSFVPDDDSDISDAFESDIDMENWSSPKAQNKVDVRQPPKVQTKVDVTHQPLAKKKETKMTDDGFKIITEIPPDDSDVSDAFTDEEDEGFVTGEELAAKKKQLDLKRQLKKPLLKIIDDFGIDDTALLGRTKEKEEVINKPAKKLKGSYNTLTLAAQKKPREEVVVIDYTKKRGSGKKKKDQEEESEENAEESPGLVITGEEDMKKLRFEVMKFGMTGFQKKKQEDERINLAIRLGAKPPKNEAINYKQLIEIRKEEKRRELEEQQAKQEAGLQFKKSSKKKQFSKNKPRNVNKVKGIGGQIGREKNGMRILSKKDIERINAS